MKISIIVAAAKNNVIGDGKQLLWHLPGDLQRFKAITTGHHILMGKKTYESIGRVLPNRTNLIISKNKNLKIDGALVFNSPDMATKFAKDAGETELMVIGGGMIYKYFLPLVDKIYLTKVDRDYQGSVLFPEINNSEWHEISSETNQEYDPHFEFKILERK